MDAGGENIGNMRIKIEMPLTGFAAQMASAKKMVGDFSSLVSKDVEKVKGSFSSLGAGIAGMGLGLLAKSFIDAAVKMDSMNRSLAVTEGNAEKAKKRMAEFIQVAKLPGLSLENITSAYTKLKQVDINGELAMRTIKGLGNAIVAFGGGTDSMERVVRQLVQMQGKGKVMAEDLMVIAESLPNIRKLMTQAFGTADTEALQKRGVTGGQFIAEITKELEKMPKSADGARNAFDNFADSMFQFKASMAESVLPAVTGVLGKLTNLMDAFKTLPEPIRKVIGGGTVVGIGGVAGLAGIGFAITQIGTAIPFTVSAIKILKTAIDALQFSLIASGTASGTFLAKMLSMMKGLGAAGLAGAGAIGLGAVAIGGISIYGKKQMDEAMKPINANADALANQEKAIKKLEDAYKEAKDKGLDPYSVGMSALNTRFKNYNVTMTEVEGAFGKGKLSLESLGDTLDSAKTKLEENRLAYWKLQEGITDTAKVTEKLTKDTKLINFSTLEDEFSKVDYTLSEAQQLSWWQAKLKIPLEPEAKTKILDIINRLNFDINKAGQESYSKAKEDFLKGQDVVSKALADMNIAYIKSVSLAPTMLPSGEMEQLLKPRAIPLPQDQAGLMEERMSRSVESITQLANSIGANAPKLDMLGAIAESNAVSIDIMNKEIDKSAMILDDAMSNSWDPFYNANVDLKGELDKSKVSFDNWTKANVQAGIALNPIASVIEELQTKYKDLYEYADANNLDKTLLQKSEAREIEDAMSRLGLSFDDLDEKWKQLLIGLSGSESQEKIKSWSDKVNDGVYKIEGAFDSLRSVFGLFMSDTQSSLSMSGWASQVQGISTDIANSATDTADKLIEAQKSYEERIAEIQKTRTEGLTNAEGKYELGMSFSDRLIQQQSERDAQIKIEKDYKESMVEAEKDYAKQKATIEADRVKSEKDSKDAELKIIADFQKSKLSALDQEKIDVNDNYTELKKLYEKYGYDTVQLEKDRQQALKDIKYQGYVDDLDKLSGWVTDTKTILSGVKDAWDGLKWAKEKYDQLTVKKPTVTGGVTGGGTGIPNLPTDNKSSIGGGTGQVAQYLPLVGVGIKWTDDYQTGKALDAAKLKASTEYADSLRGLVKNNQLTAEKANYQFIEYQHEKDKSFKKGMIINGKYMTYQEIEDYLAYTKEKFPSITQAGGYVPTTSGAIRGTSVTQTANQAPSANLNINFNLAPSQQQLDGLSRDVILSARKQGLIVKTNRA
jgi:tape measure domain-containing protein